MPFGRPKRAREPLDEAQLLDYAAKVPRCPHAVRARPSPQAPRPRGTRPRRHRHRRRRARQAQRTQLHLRRALSPPTSPSSARKTASLAAAASSRTCSRKASAGDLIATALATAYDGLDEAALVRQHIERKRLKPPTDDKSTARILRRLTAAGFGSKAIFKVPRANLEILATPAEYTLTACRKPQPETSELPATHRPVHSPSTGPAASTRRPAPPHRRRHLAQRQSARQKAAAPATRSLPGSSPAAQRDPHLVVGFDFCFSYPEWFVHETGATSAPDFWQIVADRGEQWLHRESHDRRFWGKPHKRPAEFSGHHIHRMLRSTDIDCKLVSLIADADRAERVKGITPKVRLPDRRLRLRRHRQPARHATPAHPAQRRLPRLALRPAHAADQPLVVEMYTRLNTGPVHKSNPAARAAYLQPQAGRRPRLQSAQPRKTAETPCAPTPAKTPSTPSSAAWSWPPTATPSTPSPNPATPKHASKAGPGPPTPLKPAALNPSKSDSADTLVQLISVTGSATHDQGTSPF